MQAGDLVKVVPKESADIRPFNGRIGLVIKVAQRFGATYYDVLIPGAYDAGALISTVAFRKSVLELVDAS